MDERYCDACSKWLPNNKYYFYDKRNDRRCKNCQELKIRTPKASNRAKRRDIKFQFSLPRCGVCNRLTHHRVSRKGEATTFLCKHHAPHDAGKSIEKSICDSCDWIAWCRIRVQHGLWVLCERPTVDELECNQRLELGDERIRPGVVKRRYAKQPENNLSDNSRRFPRD